MEKMNHNIVILGAAYFAREVYSMVQDCIRAGVSWHFKGFLDDRANLLDDFPHKGKILCSPDAYVPEENDRIIVALGNPTIRKKYVEIVKSRGGIFETLIHPSAQVGVSVKIGEGCVIAQNAVLTADIRVGDFVNVGVATVLSHGNKIGDYSQFAGNCSIAGEVEIGGFVEVGCNVVVVPHIKVGNHSQLCSGAMVMRRVKDYQRVIGNPAQPLGFTNEEL